MPTFHVRPDANAKIRNSPSAQDDSNVIGYINAGMAINLQNYDTSEQSTEWFVDANKWFYSGDDLVETRVAEPALPEVETTPENLPLSEAIDYNSVWEQLPAEWMNTRGEGVKIAVIDAGINTQHPALSHLSADHIFNIIGTELTSGANHGNAVSGLITAKRTDSIIKINGIADNAEFYFFKAGDEANLYLEHVITAIHKAIELDVDIISMSFFIDEVAQSQELTDLFTELSDKGIFAFCAMKNDSIIPDSTTPNHFPVNQFNTIKVGAYTEDLMANHATVLSGNVDFVLQKHFTPVCDGKGYLFFNANGTPIHSLDCSCSTAIIAAIAANYIGYLRAQNAADPDRTTLIKSIQSYSLPISSRSPVGNVFYNKINVLYPDNANV